VARDAQVISQEAMMGLDCGEFGKLILFGTGLRFSAALPAIKPAPPGVGEHHKDIDCGVMGYPEEAPVKLQEEGST